MRELAKCSSFRYTNRGITDLGGTINYVKILSLRTQKS